MIKAFNIVLFLLPFSLQGQDTIPATGLNHENGLWCRDQVPFTGIATRITGDIEDYYKYCQGKPCGYIALYTCGDTAGVHIYTGNDIHLIFYTRDGKKTLEYNQRVLDETYMAGEWADYRDDGSLQVKGHYELIRNEHEARGGAMLQYSSVKDGTWEFYDAEGRLIKTEKWKKGRLISTKTY